MYYNRKKTIIKNIIFIFVILAVAIIATYNIYYHFISATDIGYSSESLEIIFHEKDGAKIALTKATPVSDSVGLSSTTYTFTVKNNLTEPVDYQIKLVDDYEAMINDLCTDQSIPKDILRVSIKEGNNKNEIYTISELENETLKTDTIKALGEKDYTVRVWLSNTSAMSINNDFHYHGLIQIVEDGEKLATR